MEGHTILIVEDDEPTRDYLQSAVASDPALRVLAAVGSVKEGVDWLRRDPPDVLLTDLGLPDGHGVELIREARRLSADTYTLVITVFGDEENVVAAIEAGARGYLLKDADAEQVCGSVRQLLAGGAPIGPAIARHLLRRFQDPGLHPDPTGPRLSAREQEVLALVVKGFTFGEIAKQLDISVHTVTTHVRRIYRKLEVRSRSEAVYEAVNMGIVKIRE